MIIKCTLITIFVAFVRCENLTLVSQTRSGYLEKYQSYVDTVVMHFTVPKDLIRVIFKFRAREMSYSIFGCKPKDVMLYLKYGSPPVINPDGSKYPEKFLLERQFDIHFLNFTSNKQYSYANFTAPVSGSYYAVAFHPYTDPKNDGITQQGLTPECHTYVDASVYAEEPNKVIFIMPDIDIRAVVRSNQTELFNFHIPENINYVVLHLKAMKYCDDCTNLTATIRASGSLKQSTKTVALNSTTESYIKFWITDDTKYSLTFDIGKNGDDWVLGKFLFELKYVEFSNVVHNVTVKNFTYPNAMDKVHFDPYYREVFPYKQYNLHKSLSADSFMFTYEMQPINGSIPVAVNVTNEGFAVLKFPVTDIIDVGGSIQLVLAFKPRLYKKDRYYLMEKLPDNYTLVGCVRNSEKEIPVWKEKCKYRNELTPSALVLNKINENDSLLIPFPESGEWYFSFKLFCSDCVPCNCSNRCENMYDDCMQGCVAVCKGDECGKCHAGCQNKVIMTEGCDGCDCDGGCLRTNETCNATIVFDISSYPCVSEGCGSNGKCAFLVSEGFVYSSCVCNNNYRGWDCSDGSNASTLGALILEMLLLVLSNLPFLAIVVIAFQRKYYVEMIVYFSAWFFSSFYHSCDAGENIISFCITRLNVLQYCDFYCALLSIWVTMIAIAHLSPPLPHMFHIAGTIIIGAGTTLDKTSIWVFLLPVTAGVIIIAVSWGLKYYNTKILFPSKRYLKVILPSGLVFVLVGLVLYGLFQTQSNYKYIHSLWHMLMALSVMILLPKMDTFLPSAQYL